MNTLRPDTAPEQFEFTRKNCWWQYLVVLVFLKPFQVGISLIILWGCELLKLSITVDLLQHIVFASAILALLSTMPATYALSYLIWRHRQRKALQTTTA
jgi:hypothetical protein